MANLRVLMLNLETLIREQFARDIPALTRIPNGVATEGVQHLIRALAGIPGHGQMLEVAGDGPQRERSRIFVLASSSDNFPVSLLEAMAAGCAIVTTRAGGCPEVVGDAGLVVEPGDARGLGEAEVVYAEAIGGA